MSIDEEFVFQLVYVNKKTLPELLGSSSASGLGGTSESESIIQSSESEVDEEDSSPLLLDTISTTL